MTAQDVFYAVGAALLLLILALFINGLFSLGLSGAVFRCPRCRDRRVVRVRIVDAESGVTMSTLPGMICRSCGNQFDEKEVLRE